MRRCFDSRERELTFGAFDVAEDLTGDHFALSGGLDSVDLKTLIELSSAEIVPEGVFAQVARYGESSPAGVVGTARTLYRICVQDHAILDGLRRERGAVGFFPLLVYVLTHELVHVVRFARHQGPFLATGRQREVEEAIVHEATQTILRRVRVPSLRGVLDRYRHLGLGSLSAEERERLPSD